MPTARGIRGSDAADLQHGLPPGHHQRLYRWDQSRDFLRWFDYADNYRSRRLCADHFGWELHAEPVCAGSAHTPARFEDRAMIAPVQRSAPPAIRSWIVERGTQTPGGGGVSPAAPAVVIDATAPDGSANPVVINRNNDTVEVDVYYHVPGATSSNWKAAAVWVEDPDISSQPAAQMDGSTPLDGSTQVSGKWTPLRDNDTTKSPAVVKLPAQGTDRKVRIYLASFGPDKNYTLIRANDTSATPTPSTVVTIPAQSPTYVSGMDFAWLVTDVAVTVNYFFDEVPAMYSLTYSFLPPTADQELHRPPGLNPFGGCRIFFDYGDGNFVDAGDHTVNPNAIPYGEKIIWTSAKWQLTNAFTMKVYFSSEDDQGHHNTVIPGVTPVVNTTIDPGGQGQSITAPDISGFTISNQSIQWQPDGSFLAFATFTWTLPTSGSVRYSGMELYRVATDGSSTVPAQIWPQVPSTFTTVTVDLNPPSATEHWTIAAISVDTNGQLSDDPAKYGQAGFHSPTVTWIVGPPSPGTPGGGSEYASMVTLTAGAKATATESTSSDGVRMVNFALTGAGGAGTAAWTNPGGNQFTGVQIGMVKDGDTTNIRYFDVPKGATYFTTPDIPTPGKFGTAETLDFYIVSKDAQGNRNSLVPGTTPKITLGYTPTEGMIIPSRFNPSWFSPEFNWTSGNPFSVASIAVGKLQVGTLLQVGGVSSFGGAQNGQIGVFDNTAVAGNATQGLIGWIGKIQGGQGSAGWSVYGAWFKQLWVGGSDPAHAPIYIDQNGIIMVGGIAAQNNAPYPYVSIRDASGIEKGRIGAKLTSATDTSGNVGPSPPATLTEGAWFSQLALGGSSLSNWNILAGNDNTVKMRDIFDFTIDYPTNGSGGTNAPQRLRFGLNAYTTGAATGWTFPGVTLFRKTAGGALTGHGVTIINRGIVLGSNTVANLASFASYNGDSTGGDADPFYAQLVMQNPVGTQVVSLTSGSGTAPSVGNDATFTMWKSDATACFQVHGSTGIVISRGYHVGAGGTDKPVIDSAGNWVGNPISAGSPQTPWAQDVSAANWQLLNVKNILSYNN